MFKIYTDSSADLPISWLEGYGINFFSLKVKVLGRIFHSKKFPHEKICQYHENFNVSMIGKFLKIKPEVILPSKEEIKESVAKENDSIIAIHPMREFYGIYDVIKEVSEETDREMYVIDSRTVSSGLGILVWELANLRDQGLDVEEALEKILKDITHIKVFGMVYFPEILQISDIFEIDKVEENIAIVEVSGPKIKVIDYVENEREGIGLLSDKVEEIAPEMVLISHFCNYKGAQNLSMELIYPSEISEMDFAVALNFGPKAMLVGARG